MGLAKWKVELRAWLVGIVREAVREEMKFDVFSSPVSNFIVPKTPQRFKVPPSGKIDSLDTSKFVETGGNKFPGISKEAWDSTLTSYERMEEQALQEQENHYEPRFQG